MSACVRLRPCVSNAVRPPGILVVAAVCTEDDSGQQLPGKNVKYVFECVCSFPPYSLRCRWCVHFPLPDRCSPASSSLGTVSPRSPPRRTITRHCCRSNAQLHGNQRKVSYTWKSSQMFPGAINWVKINICGVRWAKRRGVLSHSLSLFVWTAVKYLQWHQTVMFLRNYPVCNFVCVCVWVCGGSWIHMTAHLHCDTSHASAFQGSYGKSWHPGSNGLTHRFAGPLPFAVSETHTLQHVVSGVMRPLPSVPDFIRPPSFMATICKRCAIGLKKSDYIHRSSFMWNHTNVKVWCEGFPEI